VKRKVKPESSVCRPLEERGVTTVAVLVALVGLIAAGALAIDVGLIWAARTQLQGATDAAALAAAMNMIDKDAPAVTLPAAEAAAIDVAGLNEAVPTSSVVIEGSDLTFGRWDLDARNLDTGVNLAIPEQVTGVEVVARLDGVDNAPVPAFLSRVLGRTSFNVEARATAYLGFAGAVGPGEVDLPIAIDCCKLRGPDCDQDYCSTINSNPPNPCPLANPQEAGATTVSCIEFFSTPEQNACWTEFDGSSPSINTPGLSDIVNDGNPITVQANEPYYMDNGDKTPVIADIYDRFHGDGAFSGNPAGIDRYPPYDGFEDSWVVGLPVVECQTDAHCAGGIPFEIIGFLCIEIREIIVTPDKIIRARFLCNTDSLYDECDLGVTGTGGDDFGVRADLPVLVR
jgi:Flp pilus assembly protein TadG